MKAKVKLGMGCKTKSSKTNKTKTMKEKKKMVNKNKRKQKLIAFPAAVKSARNALKTAQPDSIIGAIKVAVTAAKRVVK